MNIIQEIIGRHEIIIFIFTRILGLILIAPIFSRKNIPTVTKITLTFFISLILVNSIDYEVRTTHFLSIVSPYMPPFA